MKKLLLIDANSLIHRCFHALPPLTNKKGEPTGALYGVSAILLKILQTKKPDFAAALFDRPEPTLRKQKFAEYKIHRPPTPNELVLQINNAHQLFESFSIKTLELIGYEADDLIGTLSQKFKNEAQVIILTGDLDTLQLVENQKVIVETFKKGISQTVSYNEEKVKERYDGLSPAQLVDYKALVGDPSDNIPGVSGIGPKSATEILKKYQTLEKFLEKGKKEKVYEKIADNKKIALLSKELATINTAVPLEIKLEDLTFAPQLSKIEEFFKENDFNSLIKRINLEETPSKISSKENQFQKTLFLKEDQKLKKKEVVFLDKESLAQNPKDFLDKEKIKVGYHLKEIIKQQPIAPPFFDVKIALELLEIKTQTWQEASQKTLKEKNFSEKEFLSRIYPWLLEKINLAGLNKIFFEIEMPLIPVIAEMEKNGVLIDLKKLKEIQKKINQEVLKKEKEILKEVGEEINLNSPKQLLGYFHKKGIKITSTAAEKLEKIASHYPLAQKILDYREIFKLKTTYLDPLESLIQEDGRLHPTFLQLGAATGRLSCQNPNLQNIPQESSWAPLIRSVFKAPEDFLLASFDYSQIELRVLAHLSQDKNMIEAFIKDEDIHTLTAQKIFGVKKEEVTPHQRRLAKTLNFGMIYGMGYRALAQTAKISAQEAKEFIKKYFQQFPSIKDWQAEILKYCRQNEISVNINGRFRSLPYINSPNQFLASQAEREALNMPTQSLAADILKLAMIKVFSYLQENQLASKIKIILSIHDELIFEVKKELAQEKYLKKIKEIMESAYSLRVPLKVRIKTGENWGQLE
ncbi:MAG: DNA polymerase [Patescibacteria group bacterium]|nr:DNA polymerase [Patescibacteria group bacterium]